MRACMNRSNDERFIAQVVKCVDLLSTNPRHPGLNTEQLYPGRGTSLYSARINQDFRLIFARTESDQLYLLYADEHERAYRWAEEARQRVSRLVSQATRWQGRFDLGEAHTLPRLDADQPIPIADVKALRRMLRDGMHVYLSYLDRSQQVQATFDFTQRTGLMFVTGGAGTGKTAIAIHRALHLAKDPELDREGVLYVCFNRLLANVVKDAIDKIAAGPLRGNIEVKTFSQWCGEYLTRREASVDIPPDTDSKILALIRKSRHQHSLQGDLAGISDYDIAQEVKSLKVIGCERLEDYWNLERAGRRFALRRAQRSAVWQIYQDVQFSISGLAQFEDLPAIAIDELDRDTGFRGYRAVIIDEAQDCGPVIARLAQRMVLGDHRRIMVLADEAQAIYPNGYYLAKKEFRPRGAQNVVLRTPYRCTREIYAFAASVYDEVTEFQKDLDEIRHGSRSGPRPVVEMNYDQAETDAALLRCIDDELKTPAARLRRTREIAVLAGSNQDCDHLLQLLRGAGYPAARLGRETRSMESQAIKVSTIHTAKGLDFPSVYVYRLMTREEKPTAEERALLYVALTRSSFRLTVLCDQARLSPLLNDLDPQTYDHAGRLAHLLEGEIGSLERVAVT